MLGWREWVALPDLGVEAIKAKVDTGARTSALHAFDLEPCREGGRLCVRFGLHPWQRRSDLVVRCLAEVVDRRLVTDSGGHKEWRFVIVTGLQVGQERWPVELTLTDRENMGFRMLLGRTAIRGRYLVDPGRSYLSRRPPPRPPHPASR